MKNVQLKKTDLIVSNIAMGTDSLGSLINKEDSFGLLDFYAEYGGNVIDTAEGYASWIEGGEHASENVIGEWLKSRGNRNSMVLSTKGGYYKFGAKHRLTQKDIFSDLDGSLNRLGTDYIDIYWLHRDSSDVSAEEIIDILAKTVKQGKVRYVGLSNWTYNRIDEANQYAKRMNLPQIFASQIQYSPAHPNVENNEPDLVIMNQEEYEYFKNHELSVFAFASQAKGFFSKYLKGGKEELSPKAYTRYYNEETIKRFEKLNKISKEHNCSIGAGVIAALCNNYDFDTIPIVGCKNTKQLKDSLSGGNIVFSREEMNFIYGR